MISVSLCMIVKNEEDVLERCLKCVKEITDEIIIVDTGSSDNTKKIAKNYTDKIYDFEWMNDFSAARNYSFSKATKDYILWLDADDVILEEDIKKFKQLKESLNDNVDVVMIKYNTGFDENGNVTFSFFRERLIKRINNFKWQEPVHEYIQTKGNVVNSDICITHKKEHISTSSRNLHIYEKLLSQKKELSVRGLYYYAKELYNNSRYNDAILFFNQFLETQKGWIEDIISACFFLSICYHNINDSKNELETLLKSFEYDTPRAENCCQIGTFYLEKLDYKKAIFWYQATTQLKKPIDSWGFVLHDYWDFIPNMQLCLCYDKIGDIDQAIKYNNKAAELKPNNQAVLYNQNYFKQIKASSTEKKYLDYTSKELLEKAENLLIQGDDKKAAEIFEKLTKSEAFLPYIYFRLGEIENRNKHINKSYFYHKKAFELDHKLALQILAPEHPNYAYEYSGTTEIEVTRCPLCDGTSELHSCYNMITNIDQIDGFNPIRNWRICKKCNHIFAENYPENLDQILCNTAPNYYIEPNVRLFPILSNILTNIKSFVNGSKLLEVGVGAGEMISVAKEMQFDVMGLDIRSVYADNVSTRLNIPVYSVDIMKFETDQLYDVIILGDIIEHLSNPKKMIQKCCSMLNKNGIIWISTPNFESAFSYIMKDKDPMWRVCEHLNYFSFTSLNKLLNQLGLEIQDYKLSQHYNGSMEIICSQKAYE